MVLFSLLERSYDESGALVGSSLDGDNGYQVKLDNPISIQNFKNFNMQALFFKVDRRISGRDPLLDKFDNQRN